MLKLDTPEGDLAPTEAEALGLYECITHWDIYLNTGIPFDVIVDHQELVYLFAATSEYANKRIIRIILELQGYTFNIFTG